MLPARERRIRRCPEVVGGMAKTVQTKLAQIVGETGSATVVGVTPIGATGLGPVISCSQSRRASLRTSSCSEESPNLARRSVPTPIRFEAAGQDNRAPETRGNAGSH